MPVQILDTVQINGVTYLKCPRTGALLQEATLQLKLKARSSRCSLQPASSVKKPRLTETLQKLQEQKNKTTKPQEKPANKPQEKPDKKPWSSAYNTRLVFQ